MKNIQSLSYVRHEMMEEQDPPTSQIGVVGWIQDNLFNGVLSSVLTVLSLLFVAWGVTAIGTWLLNSIWNADSLNECREILQGASGACWGVIRERFPQLMFGFYPSELYWRPILSFILMFVALWPILFPSAPRKMLYLSLAYPFIAIFLLWGGSIWMSVLIALTIFGSLYAAAKASGKYGLLIGVLVGLAVIVVVFFDPIGILLGVLGYVIGLPSMSPYFESFFGIPYPVLGVTPVDLDFFIFGTLASEIFPLFGRLNSVLDYIAPIHITQVGPQEFGGFMLSITIGISGIVMSLPLGVFLALGRQSNMPLIKSVCVVFIEFFRGVPLITLLFTASLLLNYFLPPGTNFDLILRVIIMVTLFATAYMAEVIRGGLAALPRGQYEAANAMGLDYWKAQHLVIMPQAMKIAIPGTVNTFIGLFKDTTLVVFIGLLDPIGLASAIRANSAWQGIYWELFIFIGAVFWVFCFGMSRYSMHLEQRLKTDHR